MESQDLYYVPNGLVFPRDPVPGESYLCYVLVNVEWKVIRWNSEHRVRIVDQGTNTIILGTVRIPRISG